MSLDTSKKTINGNFKIKDEPEQSVKDGASTTSSNEPQNNPPQEANRQKSLQKIQLRKQKVC